MAQQRTLAGLALTTLLALSLLPAAAMHPVRAATRAAAEPQWVQWDAGSKTAHVTLVAAYNENNGFFNFDGYAIGHLTITVPLGAKVVVSFTNKASLPHSAVITPFASHTLPGNFPLAFPGASTPNPAAGAAKVKAPQVFTFTASKAGHYAIVCGVPGHAIGGMWDRLDVANVPVATQLTAETAPATTSSGPVISTGNNLGALAGVITDASTGKPVAHAMVILGWTTLARVGETDATGHYRIDNVSPVALVDAYGFADGYVYYHGHPVPIKRGQVTTYSFKLPRSTFPAKLLPTLTDAQITPTTAKAGQTVTFEAHITPGQQGPLSAENFAVNATLSHSVLLQHVGSDTYRGTWQIPAGTKPGAYVFSFIATMENCLENHPYPYVSLTITQ
jgi:sulfocyanin